MSTEQTMKAPKPTPPTKLIHDEYHVVVPVDSGSDGQRLVSDIKHHIDGGASARLNWRTQTFCKHCGSEWKGAVDGNGYPWCCNKAQTWADANGIVPEPDNKPSKDALAHVCAKTADRYRKHEATAHELDAVIDAWQEASHV